MFVTSLHTYDAYANCKPEAQGNARVPETQVLTVSVFLLSRPLTSVHSLQLLSAYFLYFFSSRVMDVPAAHRIPPETITGFIKQL